MTKAQAMKNFQYEIAEAISLVPIYTRNRSYRATTDALVRDILTAINLGMEGSVKSMTAACEILQDYTINH